MAVTSTQVQSLYVAYFGRPAEQAGLTYWTAQADATVDQISAAFAQQSEYTSVYGGLTRAQTIDNLYQNLFGRAAESNELNYWLNSTDVTVDRMALALVNGATGTDRVLLDSKVQYAAAVTTEFGQNGTVTQVNDAYDTTVAGQPTNGNVVSYYSSASTTAINTTKVVVSGNTLQNGNGAAQTSANFGGAKAGSIALTDLSGAATVALAAGNAATDLTLAGTSGLATGPAVATSITLSETDSTKIVSTLHLNVTDATVANTTTTVGVSGLTALTSIDASGSSSALTIDSSALASLATVTGGSGVDTLTVATTATNAVAQTVNAGAGADVIGATVGTAALTVNGGAGNDQITANVTGTSAAVLTVNAGDGNDIVTVNAAASSSTAAHNLSITLGAGADTLKVGTTLTNVDTVDLTTTAGVTAANTSVSANLVKVTDFSGGSDVVNLAASTTFTALSNTQAANVTAAASLAQAANLAAQDLGSTGTTAQATAFAYGGNTYVLVDTDHSGSLSAGDGMIELTGYTGGLTQGTNLTIG